MFAGGLFTSCSKGGKAVDPLYGARNSTTSFNHLWDFDEQDAANYECNGPSLELRDGVCRLVGSDQIDDTETNFQDGNFSGIIRGEANTIDPSYFSHQVMRLNSTTNLTELNESWTPQWSNLVGYWKLNETTMNTVSGSDFEDSSSNNYHGNEGNGVILGASGKLSGAATFNIASNTYVSMSDVLDFDLNQPFTYTLWMKTLNGVSQSCLVCKANSSSPYTGIWAMKEGDQAILALYNSTGQYMYRFSTPIISTGEWIHISFVYDGSSTVAGIRIFINGKEEAYSSTGGTSPLSGTMVNGHPLNFGGVNNTNHIFDGDLDEVAIWSVALSPSEVKTIYDLQSPKYSGIFTSRVMDGIADTAVWTDLSWTPTLPFLKALPDAACSVEPCIHPNSESSTDYSSLVGASGVLEDPNIASDDLMSGIVGLWHFDETALNTVPGGWDFRDNSGNGNHGNESGGIIPGRVGKLGLSPQLDGANDQVLVTGLLGIPANATLSAWVNLSAPDTNGAEVISLGDYLILRFDVANGCEGAFFDGVNWNFTSSSCAISGTGWHHLVYTMDDTNDVQKLYVDGVELASNTDTASIQYSGVGSNTLIGRHGSGLSNRHFNGQIDEVAVWSRALNPREIHQLYRRGANRIKYQVRTCANNDCSDDLIGENWKGPTGDRYSYFSELNNLTATGTVKKGLPSLLFEDFTGFVRYFDPASYDPSFPQRYFQYRVIMESDDEGSGCDYGGGPTWCSPELKAVSIGPGSYDDSSPSVVTTQEIVFSSLESFIPKLGSSCSEGIKYNLGIGGTWYWFNNGSWVATAADSENEANDSPTIQTNLSSFNSQGGTSNILVRAFLKSDGQSACELDEISITGKR